MPGEAKSSITQEYIIIKMSLITVLIIISHTIAFIYRYTFESNFVALAVSLTGYFTMTTN